MKRLSARFLAFTAVLLLGQSQASADMVVTWTPGLSDSGATIHATSPDATGGVSVALNPSYVSPPPVTPLNSTIPTGGSVTTSILLANLSTFSGAGGAIPPDSFGSPSSPNMSLTFAVTDNGQTLSALFQGTIAGNNLTNTSSNLTDTFSPTTTQLTFTDGHVYALTLGQLTGTGNTFSTLPNGVLSLPAPGTSVNLGLQVTISATSGNTGPGTGPGTGFQGVPEPSSFVLAGLASTLAGLWGWKRRRARLGGCVLA